MQQHVYQCVQNLFVENYGCDNVAQVFFEGLCYFRMAVNHLIVKESWSHYNTHIWTTFYIPSKLKKKFFH